MVQASLSGLVFHHGDGIVVRYAGDAVLGFQYREEAEKFLADLQERVRKFGLELHLVPYARTPPGRRYRRLLRPLQTDHEPLDRVGCEWPAGQGPLPHLS
ncbi:hypothetical protein SBA4_5890017 [Candidatus Sulfopaludibacter sp. SbA4]|nr:hypothetical protein SBA4_5890017 [Candidatus Sulfopaludibacter sp. SbA4]